MTTAPTGLVWHELYMWHDPGALAGLLTPRPPVQPGVPYESPEPRRRLKNLLDVSGLSDELMLIRPRPATVDELCSVHDAAYVERVRALGDAHGGEVGPHTHIGAGGFEIAALAAGGVIAATDAVLDGEVRNAYALVRPSGHHAGRDFGRGFCIFNNAAIAARHAMDVRGLSRVAIVDWDVHHGNGAESIFYEDPTVLTVSVHQDNWMPRGSGPVSSNGAGAGTGANINVPLPPGSGAGAYEYAFERVVLPALELFGPELVIVPSGFDANAFDPMARMMLHSEAFRTLTTMVMHVCDRLCGGRLVLCHEGGYSDWYVPFIGLAVVEALSGVRTGIEDPHLALLSEAAGQGLEQHQRSRVDEAASLLAHVPVGR